VRRRRSDDGRLDALERLLEDQIAQGKRLMAQLEDVQGLAARAYEASLGWPAMLADVRASSDYERAWEDPEPLVSVRIATYNNAELLCERTLPSVQAQTYERWEVVVVGDAVTDDTDSRVRALGDTRIRFINLPFRGPYPADEHRRWLVAGTRPANTATREAKGSWIAPLDHDDEFSPDHLESLLAEARATHAELVYGRLRVRHADTGEELPNVVGAWPPAHSQFGFQGAIYHAGLRAFEHDEGAYLAGEPGDWNLARRMWDAGVRFAFLDRVVTTYYWRPMDEQGRAWLEWARRQRK
jgi:glycosyltransferase involved in cell wall biosynthesis